MSLVFKIVQNLHSGMLNNQAMLDYSLIADIVHNLFANFKHFLFNHKITNAIFFYHTIKRFHHFFGIELGILFETKVHI